MAAVVWAPTLVLVDAALATATGADKTLGTSIRTDLDRLGRRYDSRYTPPAPDEATVDTAKTAWLASTEAAFLEAVEAVDFVYDALGKTPEDPPGTPTYDPNDTAPLMAYIASAGALDGVTAFQTRALAVHSSAVVTAYRGVDGTSAYTSAPTRLDRATRKRVETDISVRALELLLVAKLGDATDWLALAAF